MFTTREVSAFENQKALEVVASLKSFLSPNNKLTIKLSVKTVSKWAGDCFIYTTSSQLCLFVGSKLRVLHLQSL